MLVIIKLTGAAAIILLLAYRFTGKKQYGFWGQILLIISFGLIAFALLQARVLWIGAAFAFAALAQVYAMVAARIRKRP